MSETDALLPVTTTTRQRKTQQVIAARSSIGDTLVEETDGPQISWGPGTGVAIYSIAESSDDVGGPFSCQCIAKQCST